MKYFALNFGDARVAMEAVWDHQDKIDCPRSTFGMSACGMNASVWTEDRYGEELFRKELEYSEVKFEEGDEQQVVTWLDRVLA